jgi:glycosyltransferase involved in cell wall biosynthesis
LRLLLLSFYYAPDLSAGSFRATALAEALRRAAPPGTSIDVVTTSPNRYYSFVQQAPALEREPQWEIRRVRLPAHRSDMLGQSRAFVHFARAVRAHVAERSYRLVFATSSRLMTAALGAWIARRKRAALYLDVRDIFTATIGDVLPTVPAWPARRLFSAVESWTVRRADRINLVSPGFASYFGARYPDRSYCYFTNGIDPEFLAAPPPRPAASGRVTILYAGNIGDGQALHRILPGLARALQGRARFVVIGDGGRRSELQAALTAAGVDNVELRAPLARPELLEAYYAADVLFLHLGDHAAFENVLPSKLFEYAALGKPVLAGVGGYAARFITEEIDNAAVFVPCDVAAGAAAFGRLELVDRERPQFKARYARANIVAAMAADILNVAEGRA